MLKANGVKFGDSLLSHGSRLKLTSGCYGNADRIEPAKSALLLRMKALEKVTFEDLDAISCQNPQVVYLSA